MNLLITGASGLVGRDLLQKLSIKKYKIYAIYRDNNKLRKIYDFKNIVWIKHNLNKKLTFNYKIDFIIHCAVTHHFSKKKSKKDFINSNINSIKNLIEFAKKNRIKLFINLSTVSVYGKVNQNKLDENYLPFKPSLLGETKKKAENLLTNSGLNYINIRLPGVLCSNININNPVWLQKIIISLYKNKNIFVYDINNFFNNLIDTQEIFKLIMYLLKYKNKINDTFNFSASNPVRLEKIIFFLKKNFLSKSTIRNKNLKKSFTINNSKIKKKIGFKAESTMNILKRYLKNEKI